ncbi:MAG TPA: hypothetical protein VE092_15285 [Herbaspirillum sp.]|uniref:hypothetical protein n=1 Tax=Herbaspirillum sp. TaxID=1890675 RepID=UPI002D63161A|nr:hypothetical protein [Herbaspirillum sp.]HZG21373.1 hypothetical protein [Herbaspirillum sp.]
MEPSQSRPRPSSEPAAALLKPPGSVRGASAGQPVAPPASLPPGEVEPDGTEDPWANADDGMIPEHPEPPAASSPVLPKENHMHKPQDTPPVEVPPLDPTPPQDPIPHQNPTAGRQS